MSARGAGTFIRVPIIVNPPHRGGPPDMTLPLAYGRGPEDERRGGTFSRAGGGPLTVSQLTALIRGALVDHLPATLMVMGELSNVSRPASGHLYFTLKDSGSEARCVMWRSAAAGMRFRPVDGLAVIATGGVDVYEPRGQVQFYVRKLEPRGVGALELAFRQLREKLQKEGLFDPGRKRSLPRFPRQIAVVTSPTGAVLRDIIQTVRRRYPCVTLLVHPTRVQGDGAAEEIAAAIGAINRNSQRLGGIDVMIVGRGGGSLEDLWPFNEEAVARAIFASDIPIVSAVGHETDVSIADLVADVRAPTPTAAAELVVPLRADLLADLDERAARLRRAAGHRIEALTARLARAASNELFRDPLAWIGRRSQRVDEAAARLRAAVMHRLAGERARLHRAEVRLNRNRPEAVLARRRERLGAMAHRLFWAQGHVNVLSERRLSAAWMGLLAASPSKRIRAHGVLLEQLRGRLGRAQTEQRARGIAALAALAARLEAADPKRVLARGFSITRSRGRIVTHPAQAPAGEKVTTQTAGGEFDSRVLERGQGELFE